MIDSYERRVFLAAIGNDERASTSAAPVIGPNGWDHFLGERRFLASRVPVTCRCGYRCPGPFMEMHNCVTTLPDTTKETTDAP